MNTENNNKKNEYLGLRITLAAVCGLLLIAIAVLALVATGKIGRSGTANSGEDGSNSAPRDRSNTGVSRPAKKAEHGPLVGYRRSPGYADMMGAGYYESIERDEDGSLVYVLFEREYHSAPEYKR